jgi:CRP/FNR family transcriptional regulator, cyclic AMP receptor protein
MGPEQAAERRRPAALAVCYIQKVASLSRSGHLDVLAAIPAEHRQAVLEHCQLRKYRKDEVVWRQGEPAPFTALVAEGKAVSEYHSPGGRTVITGLWLPGDLIGANNLATHNLHQTTVRCLENSRLYVLPVEQFYTLVKSHGDLAEAVIKALSVRLHWFGHLVLVLFTQTARERVCGMLLAFSQHFGVQIKDGLLIDLNLTHETFAAMVGVTRPFLTVTLKYLERKGLIRNQRRRIVIIDPIRLQAYAGDRLLPTLHGTGKNRRGAKTLRRPNGQKSAPATKAQSSLQDR